MYACRRVAPHAGAWIETQRVNCSRDDVRRSRLTQARGLKPVQFALTVAELSSRLTQARGLKRLILTALQSVRSYVAPHAGAWIETIENLQNERCMERRASRRRVD